LASSLVSPATPFQGAAAIAAAASNESTLVSKTMKKNRAARQKFQIGYHLNSWDLTGQPIVPAIEFLAQNDFKWFEILSGVSLSTQYSRKWMQLGHKPPMRVVTDTDILNRMALLSAAQAKYGVRLSSLYTSVEFTNPAAWSYELGVLEGLARILKGFDAPVMVLGGGPPEVGGKPHSAEDYKTFCRALEEVGRRTNDMGIATVYHPHLDTFIERRDQLDRVMDGIDTDLVGLCIDPAHLAPVGSDPVDAVKTYISVIRYMHFKDTHVDPALVGYERYNAFCELGAGAVDLEGMIDVLLDHDYDGLAIIELDASHKTAEQSALESVAYIRDTLGLVLNPDVKDGSAA
jgi:inosose dehydratase